MYSAPIVPGLRASLSSQQIREQLGMIATEFSLMPEPIGGSTRGFQGGQWNAPALANPTITLGTIGTTLNPCVVISAYSVFNRSNYTTLGTGNVGLVRGQDGRLKLYDGATIKFFADDGHNIVMGDGAAELALSAAGGFFYLRTVNGTATGTPTAYVGAVACVYDRAVNKIGVYNGGWKWTAALS